ncbi:acyl-CoA dehydrogenase family protein [Alkalihalophilus lindianensis]|uniref:Acyl-CoA dehydrogenase family protein n=1 Tax=Alkalihalophilus lindianensis TaxID=1630542 RepID=A0ABU3XDJ6_9BACI|nr:acyl-CoA dehydrogenase family protein [Alkalihalophilus lindianensis]MDV2685954.1 acyl-CoA dehydrogenase family protein [Alkalihalophilus lindianensis]
MSQLLKQSNDRKKDLQPLITQFHKRAAKHDQEQSFPFENIEELKQIGYTSLTVPKRYGGADISLYEFVRLQELLAQGDGSTALSIGWHMGIIKNLGEQGKWDPNLFKEIAEEVLRDGKLINAAATEPDTGSPTRGGKPQTTASRDGNDWVINGKKTFTTMAPVLDYFIVTASHNEDDGIANFLIPRQLEGVTIEETWNTVGMRATGSHDLILRDVRVPARYLLERFTGGAKPAMGWLLHIPACYLGIAQAAQQTAIDYAKTYSPNSINGTISELPNVQQRIGENEAKLMQSRYFLHSVARKWDDATIEERAFMKPELAAVKMMVVNTANEVVDQAMRVVGANSLFHDNPLQRYYRDVRAGLHNPPMDDMTVIQLAKEAFER